MDIGAHERVRRLLAAERLNPVYDGARPAREKSDGFGGTAGASFRATLFKELAHLDGRFQATIDEVFELAEGLAKTRTLTHLYAYRQAVQKLVEELQQAFVVYEENGLDRAGRLRRFRLVRAVDDALEEVTRRVLDESTSDLAVLQAIGELHGLLLDLLI
ncbi:MAG: DUF327 family protein [Candidatus Carbobacillus altaicus]|uniref:DUF327 domain-containing protein n=1 Tax=Candidatus Carbonibacillus altaicus TaxID=2163959 RepID=A0A2R6Y0J7_9BACL|nr:DUF327 family protein [Candidatus Carbobacillus altaicus]PTQ56194.1 MAG: hypothetical protein BSOLF_0581 [Candidatus Carbobacillus altaicus]